MIRKGQRGWNLAQYKDGWTEEEDALLREHYIAKGQAWCVAQLAPRRTARAVGIRARRIGVAKRFRVWTRKEDEHVRMSWGHHPLSHIAAAIDRSPGAVYMRARELGLGSGCPQGYEYLSEAAERTGFATCQIRRIAAWAHVPIVRAYVRPKKVEGEKPRTHLRWVIQPSEIDEAISEWLKTEPLAAAARRHGYAPIVLRAMIERAIAEGEKRFTPPRGSRRVHWRVPTELVDELFARRDQTITLEDGARRFGLSKTTLGKILRQAGTKRRRQERMPLATVEALVADYRATETPSEAARRHNRCGQFVRDLVKNAIDRGDLAVERRPMCQLRLRPEVYDELVAKHLAGESGRRLMKHRVPKTSAAGSLAAVA